MLPTRLNRGNHGSETGCKALDDGLSMISLRRLTRSIIPWASVGIAEYIFLSYGLQYRFYRVAFDLAI